MPDFLAETLTWPGNRHYVNAIKTAREWGVPPLVILAEAQPSDGWTPADRKLAQALTILEAETCGQCGVPVWLAYSTDNRVQFKIESSFCYACAVLEQDRRDHEKKKSKPGEVRTVQPTTVFAEDRLPSRRESYQRMERG